MKKIALPGRNGLVDDHFGHCEYFAIYETDGSGKIAGLEKMQSPQSCGCKSGVAEQLKEKGVSVLLAGNMGAGALNRLNANGIEVIRGCSGTLEDVLASYLSGNLKDSGESCAHHHEDGHSCTHGDGRTASGDSNPEGWHIG